MTMDIPDNWLLDSASNASVNNDIIYTEEDNYEVYWSISHKTNFVLATYYSDIKDYSMINDTIMTTLTDSIKSSSENATVIR